MNPSEVKARIHSNMLRYYQLIATFQAMGLRSNRAIAQAMTEATNTPFYANYRAICYMADSAKYLNLMEQTIEKLQKS